MKLNENWSWPRGHNFFSCSAKHEICSASKSLITNNSFLLNIAEHENLSANNIVEPQ